MNAIQVISPLCPQAYLKATKHVQELNTLPPISGAYAHPPVRIPLSLGLTIGKHKCIRLMPVCLSRGDARSGDENQVPLWESLGNALKNFGKQSSVEDLLKQQIKKGEFYDEGSSGGNPPGNGGGGGGGFDGTDDEGFSGIFDEAIQVILATFGFIFVYIYIIDGAEIARLFKDYIKYLFGGRKSVRLTRALYQWERFWKKLTTRDDEVDRFWLEKAIVNTPTWWDHPEKYRHLIRAYLQEQMRHSESRSYDSYNSDVSDY